MAGPGIAIDRFVREADVPGILGNLPASGTEIIKVLGEEHVRTRKPIVYTSADSVFQIAAHEQVFGLDRLYRLCELARELLWREVPVDPRDTWLRTFWDPVDGGATAGDRGLFT